MKGIERKKRKGKVGGQKVRRGKEGKRRGGARGKERRHWGAGECRVKRREEKWGERGGRMAPTRTPACQASPQVHKPIPCMKSLPTYVDTYLLLPDPSAALVEL